MGWADVIGGSPPPTFPGGMALYSEYYPPVIAPGDPPTAPGGLVAKSVSSNQVNLSWNDNSDNESFFKIERSLATAPLSYTPHDTLSANVTAYADTGLDPMTTYFYRVSAVNENGESAFSNEVSATTEAVETASALLLGSISLKTVIEEGGQVRQHADVLVVDNNGLRFEGALVEGRFSGTVSENKLSASSDSGGVAVFDTRTTAEGGASFEFCVTRISDPGGVLAPHTKLTCSWSYANTRYEFDDGYFSRSRKFRFRSRDRN